MTRNSNGSWSKDLQKIIQRQMAELSNDTNNTIELKKAELESAISGITCDIHGKEAEVVSVKEGT
ncbi:hypothetical protein KW541_09970 [Vibrio fluvialis]|nr:hypothetical protein [Vibrio fluvialis]